MDESRNAGNAMPLDDIYEETVRVLGAAGERGVTLRLLGGMAVRFRCKSALSGALSRKYADIDLVGHAKQTKQIKSLFLDMGYSPRLRFNAMHGDKRLVFNDLDHERRVDVFLDVFEMCHKLNFKDRLDIVPFTLAPADLLATKLQVVEMTEREYKDLMCLLLDHSIGATDGSDMINGSYLAKLAADDWGIFTTFKQTLRSLLGALDQYGLNPEQQRVVKDHANQILRMIEAAPKTMRWRLRARVGERTQWYELPEADKEIVD